MSRPARSAARSRTSKASPSSEPKALAERLLDAQVEWALGELRGERLAAAIDRDAADLLALADEIVLEQAISREEIKALARRYVAMVGDSDPVERLTREIATAIYTLAAADEHTLGDVIAREHVEAIVASALRMRGLRDRSLERLGESPVVATVAAWFVNRLVTDFMNTNAARAERLPAVGRLAKAGRHAAGAVRSQADRHLGDVIGDVAGRGAQAAFRSLSGAIRDTMDEAPLREAAMEIWDLQAGEPISGLRDYLSQDELGELVEALHQLWLTFRDTEYFGATIDAGIEVFFEGYGSHTAGALLDELGIDRVQLQRDARTLIPPVIEAAAQTGELERLVRERLEPFWHDEQTLALLGGDQ